MNNKESIASVTLKDNKIILRDDNQLIITEWFKKLLFNERLSEQDRGLIRALEGHDLRDIDLILMLKPGVVLCDSTVDYLTRALQIDQQAMGVIARRISMTGTYMAKSLSYLLDDPVQLAFESVVLKQSYKREQECTLWRVKQLSGNNMYVPVLASPEVQEELACCRFGLVDVMFKVFPNRSLLYIPSAEYKVIDEHVDLSEYVKRVSTMNKWGMVNRLLSWHIVPIVCIALHFKPAVFTLYLLVLMSKHVYVLFDITNRLKLFWCYLLTWPLRIVI